MKLRFYSLWSINAPLQERRLCEQLDLLRRFGFDGAVFHPRFYPNVPPYLGDQYMAVLSHVIHYAKSIGMEFWIYDEDGWPSGTVGGQLLKLHPQDAQQWADLVTTAPITADSLGSFEHAGRRWHLARRRGAGVDYLNLDLTQHFLQMTHERYRVGLEPSAFEYVSTFFCDEPEFGLGHAYDHLSPFGSIPWTPQLPKLYRKRYGRSLDIDLPLLFFPADGAAEARVRFWELLTDIFCESFIDPIDKWCLRHGKRFTAHVKGEEHPLFQVPMVGSCHQVFQHLSLPGIDALERFPSGHFFPCQVASAAQQFGNGDCMAEAFGGAGWGATPADLERYLQWLVGHGINHLVLHLFQSKLNTHAIHDWPPSIPAHVNWRDVFPELIHRTRNFAKSIDRKADTLIVAPYRGIIEKYEPCELLQTNIHNASTYPDTPASRINRGFLILLDREHQSGAGYHISDERTLENHGREENNQVRIGHCLYRNVIIAEGAALSDMVRRSVACLHAVPQLEPMSAVTTPQPPTIVQTVNWNLLPGTVNSLVLEPQPLEGTWFSASFHATHAANLEVIFADPVESASLNETALKPGASAISIPGNNEIRFACSIAPLLPFLAVRGKFAVLSRTPFTTGPYGTIITEGPFTIEPSHISQPGDLIATGYPFCQEPLILQCDIEFKSIVSEIHLLAVRADSAYVTLDGIDCGWCWAPDWTVRIPVVTSPGLHKIEVRLISSTFNIYGPHHHIDGDRPIVSPRQYEYVKNFADRRDAPQNTRTAAWHFKPVGIDSQIGLRASL